MENMKQIIIVIYYTKTFLVLFLKTKNRDNVAVTIKLYKDENLNFMIYIVGLKKDSLTPKKSDMIDKAHFIPLI